MIKQKYICQLLNISIYYQVILFNSKFQITTWAATIRIANLKISSLKCKNRLY